MKCLHIRSLNVFTKGKHLWNAKKKTITQISLLRNYYLQVFNNLDKTALEEHMLIISNAVTL